MIINSTFIKWLTITVPTFVGALICGKYGLYEHVYQFDKSFLSFTIIGLFIATSLYIGKMSFNLQRKGIELCWLISEQCLTLGMIGTVIGFLMMLGDMNILTSDVEAISRFLAKFSIGFGTALYTTIVGLICSSLLKLQLFNISYTVGKIND
jgi:hypothetical protein